MKQSNQSEPEVQRRSIRSYGALRQAIRDVVENDAPPDEEKSPSPPRPG